jgi:hypothetical protein
MGCNMGSTASCVRSHRRASINNVFITVTVTNGSNPFQLYGGDDEQAPGMQALHLLINVL